MEDDRKPLLYEGDILLITPIPILFGKRHELMDVEETPEGKILIIRKAEDYGKPTD